MANTKPEGDGIAIYSPEKMQQLIGHLWNTKRVPQAQSALFYVVLGAFAGLRPAEAVGLDWPSVDFTERRLRVVAETAKTERIISLKENLFEFLSTYKTRRGLIVIHKKVATVLRNYCVEAGVPHIPNGLRRSYIAYRLAEGGAVEELHREVGMPVEMIQTNFTTVPNAEAARNFWMTCPSS